MEIEPEMLAMETIVPVYFAVEDDALLSIYEQTQAASASQGSASAAEGGLVRVAAGRRVRGWAALCCFRGSPFQANICLTVGAPGITNHILQPPPAGRNLHGPGIEPSSFALAGVFITSEPPGNPYSCVFKCVKNRRI